MGALELNNLFGVFGFGRSYNGVKTSQFKIFLNAPKGTQRNPEPGAKFSKHRKTHMQFQTCEY